MNGRRRQVLTASKTRRNAGLDKRGTIVLKTGHFVKVKTDRFVDDSATRHENRLTQTTLH
jgi:hypothetical protein